MSGVYAGKIMRVSKYYVKVFLKKDFSKKITLSFRKVCDIVERSF